MMKPGILTMLLIILPSILVYYYLLGYRITALQAANKHFAYEKSSVLLHTIDFGWISVFLFQTSELDYLTLFVEKRGFLYRSSTAMSRTIQSGAALDMISMSSHISNSKELTFIAVRSNDKDVVLIEAGPPNNRIRTMTSINGLIILKWDAYLDIQHLNPIALTHSGKLKYKYDYSYEGWRLE
jgi:hypothetical protein